MTNQELSLLLESILALIETGHAEKAAEIIKNGIKRIEKSYSENEEK